ncbi:hypothetical protein PYV61_16185, partial [Roseisolibacter sp. H3M3-2]
PAACPPPASASARAPTLRVRSMLPAVRAWDDATRDAAPAARQAAFRRMVVDAHPDVFGPVFAVPDSAGLARYLEWLTPRLPAAYRVAAHLERELPPAAARMAALLPPLAGAEVPVVLGLTLGRTNGTVRLVDGRPVLFLGVEVQTILSDRADDAAATAEHELTHVAHARANPALYARVDAGVRGVPTPLYVSLFAEGLAAWAVGCATPGRTAAQRLMSADLPTAAPAAAARLLPELAADLESTDPKRYADWFFVGGRRADVPARFAYWAGERVVARMAGRRTAEALLRLDAETVLREVREGLR